MNNKKIKVISSMAVAGLLTLNVFSANALVAQAKEVDDTVNATRPLGVYRSLISGENKAVAPVVVQKDTTTFADDYVTVDELVNSDKIANITAFNGDPIDRVSKKTMVKTGDTITVSGNETVTVVVYGDVNKDGLVDGDDASEVLKYDVGGREFDSIEKLAADVKNSGNNKGTVDGDDASHILRYDVGMVSAIEVEPEAEKMETKLDKIYTDGTNTKIDMAFNTNPTGFHYTLVDTTNNNKEISVTATIGENNKVTLAIPTPGLSDGSSYVVTVTDKDGKEVKKETFTYRKLKAITTAKIENSANGINADNHKSLLMTVSTGTAVDSVDKTVIVTLKDTDNNTVELLGTIAKNLVDTKVSGDVSSLKDGKITVITKVYDEEGNTTEATLKTTFLKGVKPSLISNINTTRTNYTDANVTFDEIVTNNGITLSKVYYKVVEDGGEVPSVNEIVEGKQNITGSGNAISKTINSLENDNMYNIYMVTENNVGTLSEVIVAPIAKDGIEESLDKVANIKSTGNGIFTWEDNQDKVTGYKVQLAQYISGTKTIIAEKTVNEKTVDFYEEIKEQEKVAKYTIDVTAIGDYKTIDNSETKSGNENNAEEILEVTQLNFASVAVSKLNDSNIRITVTNDVDDRASGIKIDILKGAMVKNAAGVETFQFIEENKVYSEIKNVTDRWYDIDTSNFKDGAYQVNVTAIKDSDDIKLLDSAVKKAAPVYAKITEGIELLEINSQKYEADTTVTATVTIAPFELDGFEATAAKYTYKCVPLNNNGEVRSDIPTLTGSVVSLTPINKTSLSTFDISGLNKDTKYRVYLEVTPEVAKVSGKAIFTATTIPTFSKSVDITTTMAPIPEATNANKEYTIVKFDDKETDLSNQDEIALSKDGTKLLTYSANGNKELTGSNAEQVKAIVSKLDNDDKIIIDYSQEKTIKVVLNSNVVNGKNNTRTVRFENTIKDCDLEVIGTTAHLTKVLGNLGKGTVTLSGNGEINVQGLTITNNEITVTSDGLWVDAAIGTTVNLTKANSNKINGVTVNGVAKAIITDSKTLSIPVNDVASTINITADVSKDIMFIGTQPTTSTKVVITSVGENTKITVKTLENSKINAVEVNATGGSTIDLSGAYITGNTTTTSTASDEFTLITHKKVDFNGMTIEPKAINASTNSVITISNGINGTKVEGEAKITYDSDAVVANEVVDKETTFEKTIEVTTTVVGSDPVKKSFELSINGIAKYTLTNDDPDSPTKSTLTIILESGTVTLK